MSTKPEESTTRKNIAELFETRKNKKMLCSTARTLLYKRMAGERMPVTTSLERSHTNSEPLTYTTQAESAQNEECTL